jgi:hypothetical protein
MLKTLAVVVLAMGMSVGMAQARGHMHMQKPLSPCETERPSYIMRLRSGKNDLPRRECGATPS